MSFLGNLSASSKPKVYISVTPEVGLEMIQLDTATHSVAAYAVRDLAYNEATRDISDYEAFKTAVAEMFEELSINPKCDVIVNMPLVTFGTMQFPLLLPDASITGGIESEVEQSYTFRRAEPSVAWQDVPSASEKSQGNESRQVLYTAIQKVVISNISDALGALGARLVGVETSLVSTLRALDFAGYTQEQMQPNMVWNLMIINSTGYSIVSLSGKNVVDYYEEPLAIKSFEGDEIYNAINQSAQIALMSTPANYLFIVSDTDQVSASLLASKLQAQGSVTVLENNSFKKDSLIPVGLNVLPNYATKISLQAIGCALADTSDYPLNLQFAPGASSVSEEASCTIRFGDQEITLTAAAATKIVGIFGGALILILVIISYMIMPKLVDSTQQKLNNVMADIKTIDEEISKYQDPAGSAFNVKVAVENGIKANRAKLMNYVAAGDSIPKTVWLTYFMTQGDGLVDIKGVSSNVEDVYVFFRNMRDSLIGTKLRLQKLEMESQSVDEAISSSSNANYNFEITNMTDDQLKALMTLPTANSSGQSKQQNSSGSGNNTPPQSGLLSSQPIQQ